MTDDDAPDLDRTDDESEWRRPATNPGRRVASSPKIRPPSTADLEAARVDDTRGWEWSRELIAKVEHLESVVAAHVRRWKLIRHVLTGVGGVAVTALVAAFKLAYSSGASSGVASERDRRFDRVEAVVQQLTVDVARITGELRSFNPIGSIRRQGPPPAPQE